MFPLQQLLTNDIDEYELRLVIWRVKKIPKNNNSKISIQVKIEIFQENNNEHEKDETDIHYNSNNGNGVFNYRFINKLLYPKNFNKLNIKVFSNSVNVSEYQLDLTKSLKKIHKTKNKFIIKKCWQKLSGINYYLLGFILFLLN